MLQIGDSFDGYTIVRCQIAQGGSSTVHEAMASDGVRVAIKVLDRKLIEEGIRKKLSAPFAPKTDINEEIARSYAWYIKLFKEEYQTLVGISHPHVARVHGLGVVEGALYIAQEFVKGTPISEFLFGKKFSEMIPFFVQTLEGLDFIHRCGLIHLDIKPPNIIIDASGATPEVKIIDFGVATTPGEYTGEFLGTRPYMAPEVILGRTGGVDARADLFSMGALMYECLTWGSLPFARTKGPRDVLRRTVEAEGSPHPPSEIHAVPEWLDTIILRLLAKHPQDRFYGNARAVINALVTHIPDAFRETPGTRASYLKPIGDVHIGHEEELRVILTGIDELLAGRQPDPAIFCVHGATGLGKSHFLKTVADSASKDIDKISISSISFPSDGESVKNWAAHLTEALADNKRPTLVLVDNLGEKPAWLTSLGPSPVDGVIRLITERTRTPDLYADIQPAMVVYTTGKEEGLLPPAHVINLIPFERAEVRAYLASTPAFQGKEMPDDWIDSLHRHTAGIPQELVEHLREMDSQGLLFGPGGEIVVAAAHGVEMPSRKAAPLSTQDRLLGAYRSLNDSEKSIVNLLACWGFLIPPRRLVIDEVMRLIPDPILLHHIHVLAQKGIVIHDDATRACALADEDYMPAIAFAEMGPGKRRRIHGEIAHYLESLPSPSEAEKDTAILHRGYSAESMEALKCLLILSRKLLYRKGRASVARDILTVARQIASRHFQKTTPYIESLRLEAALYEGDYKGAMAAFENGCNVAKSLGNCGKTWFATLCIRAIPVNLALKQYENAKENAKIAREILPPNIINIPTISLMNGCARTEFEMRADGDGHVEKAIELYTESTSLEDRIDPRNRSRIVNNDLGTVLASVGRHNEAADFLEKKLEKLKVAGDIFNIIRDSLQLADALRMAGQYEKAFVAAKRALDLAVKTGMGRWRLFAHEVLANVYHDCDRFEESIEESLSCLAASASLEEAGEHRLHTLRLWLHMGHCRKELGDLDRAILHFEAVLASDPPSLFKVLAEEGIGKVLCKKGDWGNAILHLNAAEASSTDLSANVTAPYLFRILVLKFRAFMGDNDRDSAAALLPAIRALAGDNAKLLAECNELEKALNEPLKCRG